MCGSVAMAISRAKNHITSNDNIGRGDIAYSIRTALRVTMLMFFFLAGPVSVVLHLKRRMAQFLTLHRQVMFLMARLLGTNERLTDYYF